MKNTTEEKIEIYPWRNKPYEILLAKIEAWKGSPENKEHLKDMLKRKLAKKDTCTTISKTLTIQMRIFEMFGKDAGVMTHKDAEDLMIRINTNPDLADSTTNDYGRVLKEFLLHWEDLDPRLYSNNNDERKDAIMLYKYVRKHIKNIHKNKAWDFSEIITEEDFWNLLKGCRTPMEEAVLAILFWTGVRIGELANLRIKDIIFEAECVMIRVVGKTGDRRIPMIEPAPYIKKWLQQHPHKDNPNASLWVSRNNRFLNRALKHVGYRVMLERIFENVGYLKRYEPTEQEKSKKIKSKIESIKKKCNPHWFRHSRATLWAPLYKEHILCELMGWQVGSRQAKVYLHLGASQVKTAFLEANNLLEKQSRSPDTITCLCGESNNRRDNHCYKCFRPLSIDVALNDAKQRDDVINESVLLMSQIIANPALKKQFEEFQKTNIQKA